MKSLEEIHPYISIHALLAESDLPTGGQTFEINLFLSTLSLRRATCLRHGTVKARCYFYPRSPCGERPRTRADHVRPRLFLSTLSLRRATVLRRQDRQQETRYFYPRSPCGERPARLAHAAYGVRISIHALLAESDGAECLRL